MKRYDLSEPQNGKGACDRSSAHQKTHAARYLNEGNDICTASDLKSAIDSNGGVKACKAIVVELKGSDAKKDYPRIPEISLLHNFEYDDEYLRVWKGYGIGKGRCIAWSDLEKGNPLMPSELTVLEDAVSVNTLHVNNVRVKLSQNLPASKQPKSTTFEEPEPGANKDEPKLFVCPEEGCVKEFLTFNGLDRHLATGAHTLRASSAVPLSDIVKLKWASKFDTSEQATSSMEVMLSTQVVSTQATVHIYPQGWALKTPRKTVRYSDKVKLFLKEKFSISDATGNKVDPQKVASDMRMARDEQGNRLFAAKECLSQQQIRSYFSRLAAAKRKGTTKPDNVTEEDIIETENDVNAEEFECGLQTVRREIAHQVAYKHPLEFNQYNICELLKKPDTLKKFSISMLRKMCEKDVTDIPQNRKEGFIIKLKQTAEMCTCSI